jgi:hypothetical protein
LLVDYYLTRPGAWRNAEEAADKLKAALAGSDL